MVQDATKMDDGFIKTISIAKLRKVLLEQAGMDERADGIAWVVNLLGTYETTGETREPWTPRQVLWEK